jgi:citrate lyase subunit beta/citryl-CoA lyase
MPGADTATEVRVFEAGRAGGDVRSDCRVRLRPRERGGIELELESRVAPYYGDNIRAQVGATLEQLGVEHAHVHVQDEGALPFVIAARVETAVRRAGLGKDRHALPPRVPRPPVSHRDRMRRSRLYVPGNEPKYFINAGLHGPDAIILDLEDSVHAAEKDAARLLVRNALRAVDFGGCERMVRINQLPLGLKDLGEVVPELPDVVLIPKVERPEQVLDVDNTIRDIIYRTCEHKDHIVWLMPILESALGIESAFAIATASERNAALTIGLEDYTADLGVAKTRNGDESLYARLRMVNAAHAAGLQAIDSVYGDIDDIEGLRMWGERARGLGFEGMGCAHPTQIPVIHQAFAPTPAEIEKAQKIVAAFEAAQARGLGVVSLASKMVDAPVVHRALKLVQRAKQMGVLAAD